MLCYTCFINYIIKVTRINLIVRGFDSLYEVLDLNLIIVNVLKNNYKIMKQN